VYNRGLSLDELENADTLKRMFYTASMMYCKEEETKNQVALAKVSNLFLKEKK
jgi:hypothetical protein